MKTTLDSLQARLDGGRNYDSPPLQLWHPKLSGDIPIVIDSDGQWHHDGGKIERHSLVCLFASILRREEDGEYYLVTPREKWRIRVERHPLIVTDIGTIPGAEGQLLEACLNTGKRIAIGNEHPLFLDTDMGGVAGVCLPHRLTALCTRSAWYRLVEMADTTDEFAVLKSGSYEFRLSAG